MFLNTTKNMQRVPAAYVHITSAFICWCAIVANRDVGGTPTPPTMAAPPVTDTLAQNVLAVANTRDVGDAPAPTPPTLSRPGNEVSPEELATPPVIPEVSPQPLTIPSILPTACQHLAKIEIRVDKKPKIKTVAVEPAAGSTPKDASTATRDVGGTTPTPPIVDAAALAATPKAPPTLPAKVAIERLYEAMGDTPLWTRDGQATTQAEVLVKNLQQADRKGLAASVYVGNIDWLSHLQSASAGTERICRDLALSVTAMRYISHLRMGQVAPRKLGMRLDLSAKQLNMAEFIAKLASAGDPDALLAGLESTLPPYRQLLQSIQPYAIAAIDPSMGVKLSTIRGSVRPGQTYKDAGLLARRLEAWGDIPTGQYISIDGTEYTEVLAEGIKQFQRRNGLRPDGLLGPNTLKTINTPLDPKRLKRLLMALERWRWMPDNLGYRPIIVNIPEFRLYALENNAQGWYDLKFEMNVIVGKNNDRHRTPPVHSMINIIEFTPYWNVPVSIIKGELYNAVKNPGFLASRNYEIVGPKGKVVSGGGLGALLSGKLRLRQKPGGNNALGEAKFRFPNDFAVYLHGTPNKNLFQRGQRALSHGCIRLANPAKLAGHLLSNDPGWDQKKVNNVIASKKNTHVRLKEPTAVYLIYHTTMILPDGKIRMVGDTYGYDKPLLDAIEQARKETPPT